MSAVAVLAIWCLVDVCTEIAIRKRKGHLNKKKMRNEG